VTGRDIGITGKSRERAAAVPVRRSRSAFRLLQGLFQRGIAELVQPVSIVARRVLDRLRQNLRIRRPSLTASERLQSRIKDVTHGYTGENASATGRFAGVMNELT